VTVELRIVKLPTDDVSRALAIPLPIRQFEPLGKPIVAFTIKMFLQISFVPEPIAARSTSATCAKRRPFDKDVSETLLDEAHAIASPEPVESIVFEPSKAIDTVDPAERKYEDCVSFRLEKVKLTSEFVITMAFVALDPVMITGVSKEMDPLNLSQVKACHTMLTGLFEMLHASDARRIVE
jgi:hypothetical protein